MFCEVMRVLLWLIASIYELLLLLLITLGFMQEHGNDQKGPNSKLYFHRSSGVQYGSEPVEPA